MCCLAAAATLPVSRALERAVATAGRCFFRPAGQTPYAPASNCLRALGFVHSETFFLYAKKSCLAAAATLPVSRAFKQAVVSLVMVSSNSYAAPRALSHTQLHT